MVAIVLPCFLEFENQLVYFYFFHCSFQVYSLPNFPCPSFLVETVAICESSSSLLLDCLLTNAAIYFHYKSEDTNLSKHHFFFLQHWIQKTQAIQCQPSSIHRIRESPECFLKKTTVDHKWWPAYQKHQHYRKQNANDSSPRLYQHTKMSGVCTYCGWNRKVPLSPPHNSWDFVIHDAHGYQR